MDYEKNKYITHFLQLVNIPVKKASFEKDGEVHNVYDYVISNYPYLKEKIDPELPVTAEVTFPKVAKSFYAIPTLLKGVLRTDCIPPEIFGKSILEPEVRAGLISHFRDYFQNIKFGDIDLQISANFLSSKDIRGGHLDFPDLEFGEGRIVSTHHKPRALQVSLYGWKKIKEKSIRKCGPYERCQVRRPLLVYPRGLDRGKVEIFGSEVFGEVKKIQKISRFEVIPYTDVVEISRSIRKAGSNFCLCVLPQDGSREYFTFKRELSNIGVQCIQERNILPLYAESSEGDRFMMSLRRRYPSILFNVAMSLLIKTQGIPWVLATPLNYDCYIGVDVGENVACYSFVFGRQGRYISIAEGEAQPGEKIAAEKMELPIVNKFIELRKLMSNYSPSSVVVHRDGEWRDEEENGLLNALRSLIAQNVLDRNIQCAVINIKKKSHPFRLFEKINGKIVNPTMGSYFLLGENSAVLTTTGVPTLGQGTAQPLVIELKNLWGEFDIKKAIEDVFFLSELNWGSPSTPSKLPITIQYTDAALSLISKGIEATTVPY